MPAALNSHLRGLCLFLLYTSFKNNLYCYSCNNIYQFGDRIYLSGMAMCKQSCSTLMNIEINVSNNEHEIRRSFIPNSSKPLRDTRV